MGEIQDRLHEIAYRDSATTVSVRADDLRALLAERNRNGWSIEVDDGALVARQGDVSVTVAAPTATLYRVGSGNPATKESLDEFFPEKVLALLAHPSSPDHKNTELRNEA